MRFLSGGSAKNLEKDTCLDVFKKEGMILELMNLLSLKFKKLSKRKVQRWFVSTVYIKRWICNHLEAIWVHWGQIMPNEPTAFPVEFLIGKQKYNNNSLFTCYPSEVPWN